MGVHRAFTRMTGVLVRRGEKTEGPGPDTAEAEIGELQPRNTDAPGKAQQLEAGGRPPPRAARESGTWVWGFRSHFCAIRSVCCFTSPTLSTSSQQPREILVYIYHPFINPKEVSRALNVDEKEAHTRAALENSPNASF